MPKKQTCTQQKVEKVMHEFKHGTLKSRGGRTITSRDQAVAIAMSEARKKCGGSAGRKKK